ncbi:unnamed protein product [Toxocara canis]|uniref:TOG domain-containing protein n=1 Tax=Toxocara canis TaxID=6265 RepID=A0A183UIY3_TOXCA|nr:unnamed protein product [Toxocara canis]
MLGPISSDRIPTPSLLPRDDDIIELLRSNDFDVRLQTLNRLSAIAKRDPQWFPKFVKKGDLFKQFDRLLVDDRWEVQHQCIKFLLDAMPTFGNNVEWCISYLLPRIIMKLGSSKITVRRVTNQMLTTYLRLQPDAVNIVQKMLISFLLNYDNEPAVRYEVLNELPNLFIPECRPQNWSTLVDGLTKWMLISEPKFQEKIALVLADVNSKLILTHHLRTSSLFSVTLCNQLTPLSGLLSTLPLLSSAKFYLVRHNEECILAESTSSGQSLSDTMATEKRNRFGIIPAMVSSMLNNDTEASTRITGLEQTKMIIEKISAEDIRKFVPHLHSYFVTLGNVLDDLNFKVVVVCLDVVRLTIERLNGHIAAHEQQIVSIISKHFGNQKAVIKQLIMNICMNLMQNVTAKSVIALLCVYLEHQNSRIREEIINVITAALLTFNTSKMNLNAIAAVIAPLLTDPKRRVRMAAFENYALLASLSSGRVETLLKYVREVEHKYRSFGLLNAVTARLSRECLPRIRYDGLIEYSSPISLDASINLRGMTQMSEFLDLDWILSANCGPSSAFSRTLSPRAVDIGSIRSVAHASSFVKAVQQQPSEERKMPWETENDYRVGLKFLYHICDDMLPSPDSVPVARRHSYEEEVEAKRQQQQQQQQEQDSDGMCL